MPIIAANLFILMRERSQNFVIIYSWSLTFSMHQMLTAPYDCIIKWISQINMQLSPDLWSSLYYKGREQLPCRLWILLHSQISAHTRLCGVAGQCARPIVSVNTQGLHESHRNSISIVVISWAHVTCELSLIPPLFPVPDGNISLWWSRVKPPCVVWL